MRMSQVLDGTLLPRAPLSRNRVAVMTAVSFAEYW
jgi:hypothetical protein